MKTTTLIIITIIVLFPLLGSGQSAKLVNKALKQTVKSTSASSVPVPGVKDKSEGSSNMLANAVGSAVGGAFKVGKKAALWSTKGLGPVQIGKIATSGSPFSTLLEMKGQNARKEFEGMVGDQLEKSGALDLLDHAEGLEGFDLTGGGKDKDGFVKKVTDNTIKELDKKGAEILAQMGES